eukprot:6427423-Pyramimonas_sp.AAC.1
MNWQPCAPLFMLDGKPQDLTAPRHTAPRKELQLGEFSILAEFENASGEEDFTSQMREITYFNRNLLATELFNFTLGARLYVLNRP